MSEIIQLRFLFLLPGFDYCAHGWARHKYMHWVSGGGMIQVLGEKQHCFIADRMLQVDLPNARVLLDASGIVSLHVQPLKLTSYLVLTTTA